MDTTQTQLVSITDFRRNAGAYIRRAMPITIIKDSQIVGKYTPIYSSDNLTTNERIQKVKTLAGGYNLGNLSLKKLHEIFEMSYD